MQEKLTVGELKIALEGVPEDLVVEFTGGDPEGYRRILEYAKRLEAEEGQG